MTRLILTADNTAAGCLLGTDIADIVINFDPRFVWCPLPSDAELATFVEARSTKHSSKGPHWLDDIHPERLGEMAENDLGLVELCERCETIELWIDPDPNSQLVLIWLLDTLRHHAKIVSKLALVQANVTIGAHSPDAVASWRLPAVKIRKEHLETASAAWLAYRAPTPQAWVNLLDNDLSVLPQLRQSALELLEELPMDKTGLGATEMRVLELISPGDVGPSAVLPGHLKPMTRRVFDYWEIGSLLDGLARCPAPAVSGLDEGPFTEKMHRDSIRYERYKRSKLKPTELGQAILNRTDDFSRHNPIHRWWGGTELTNDRLWRWDPVHRELIAP